MRAARLTQQELAQWEKLRVAWHLTETEREALEACPYDTEGTIRPGDFHYRAARKLVRLGPYSKKTLSRSTCSARTWEGREALAWAERFDREFNRTSRKR